MSGFKYKYRHLARVIIEAESPLAVGTGDNSVTTDSTIARDVNGLPYIPGSAVAGVVRHAFLEEDAKPYFGHQDKNSKDGFGSMVIFSEARMVGKSGEVLDGIAQVDNDKFYQKFVNLPIRQHVKINENGVATKGGKFDNEIVYKGTRFCFEVEMISNDEEDKFFSKIIEAICSDSLQMGGGTRKGYGDLKVVSLKKQTIDLETDLNTYLNKSSSLADDIFWKDIEDSKTIEVDKSFSNYQIKLTTDPYTLFLFGSGYGDKDAEMTPVKEEMIVWDDNKDASFKEKSETILIPASSIKGALRHRTTFHFNRLNKYYADIPNEEGQKECETEMSKLFGSEGNNGKGQTRGNVIISDIIKAVQSNEKVLHHIKIDRFTGGGIDGALFNEKVTSLAENANLVLNIKVKSDVIADANIKNALEAAIKDLCSGALPLGGGVNRGHGVFTGNCPQIESNNE